MSGMTLTDHEVAALRALADPAIADEPGPAVAWPVLEQVRTLVGADEVELDQTDPRRGWLGYLMSAKSHSYVEHEPDDPRFWDLYWVTEPCVTADRNDRGVTLLSDIYSDRQWRSAAIYAEYTRDTGLFHEMHVILPDPAGHLIRLHCWRAAGRDFTERQRFLLGLARPHLVEAYRTAQARRHPLPDLTRRLRAARARRTWPDQPAGRTGASVSPRGRSVAI